MSIESIRRILSGPGLPRSFRFPLIPFVLFSVIVAASCGPDIEPPPSDASLMQSFGDQTEAFRAVENDPVGAPLPPRPEGLLRIDRASGLHLAAWRVDLAGPGGTCSKGYALLEQPPAELTDGLDGLGCPDDVEAYVPMGGRWYLYYSAVN